jgi:hypothetical protein
MNSFELTDMSKITEPDHMVSNGQARALNPRVRRRDRCALLLLLLSAVALAQAEQNHSRSWQRHGPNELLRLANASPVACAPKPQYKQCFITPSDP